MERLVTVKDVCERYGCTTPTARKYLRQMFHYEAPLAAPRWAFDEWEESRIAVPHCSSKREKIMRRSSEIVTVPRKR